MVERPALRIVFFGTPEFAVPTLDALLRSAHTVAGVVTQPDRPRGRGHKTSDAPIKSRAVAAGVPVFQPATLKDEGFLQQLRRLEADLGVVAAYGKMLTDAVLATPRLGLINVHASLLPRHRGAAPVHRAVIAGDSETGITIMRVVKALDAGPMLAAAKRPIQPDETSDVIERDLARSGAELLVATVEGLARGRAHETPQDDANATYAPRLKKDEGLVDWAAPARHIHNLIRGLHPWPHAFSFLNRSRLILLRSSPSSDSHRELPGTILEAAGDRLVVAAGEGTLRLEQLQVEGKRAMVPREFLAGHRLGRGDRFTTGR